MVSVKFKDCPFCGARSLFDGHKVMQETYGESCAVWVECAKCGARGPRREIAAAAGADGKIARAALAWNLRNSNAEHDARKGLAAMEYARKTAQNDASAQARMRRWGKRWRSVKRRS